MTRQDGFQPGGSTEARHFYSGGDFLQVPDGEQPVGFLALGTPDLAVRQTICQILEVECLSFKQDGAGFIWLSFEEVDEQSILQTLSVNMTVADLDSVRAIQCEELRQLDATSILQMGPILSLMQRAESEWVISLIREERMLTAFQPIFDLTSEGKVFAHECLMRGVLRDGTIVSPGKMIPAARKSKLMYHLDQLARKAALRNAAEQKMEGHLFINFNPSTILKPESIMVLLDNVLEVGFDPEKIVFEVTESEEVEDLDQLLRVMEYYREAGFKVAVDDLGSGYNGLNILSQLKPDFVKIDAGLIREVDLDAFKQTIASHLISLSRKLNIKTVIEGIETQGELDWVLAQGADYAQGYLLARPDFNKYPENQGCPAILAA